MQRTAKAANPPIMVNISSSQLDIEHPHIPPPPALQDRPFSPARRWGKRSSPAARHSDNDLSRQAFPGRSQPLSIAYDSGGYTAADQGHRDKDRPTRMDEAPKRPIRGWRLPPAGQVSWRPGDSGSQGSPPGLRAIWFAAVRARKADFPLKPRSRFSRAGASPR